MGHRGTRRHPPNIGHLLGETDALLIVLLLRDGTARTFRELARALGEDALDFRRFALEEWGFVEPAAEEDGEDEEAVIELTAAGRDAARSLHVRRHASGLQVGFDLGSGERTTMHLCF